MVDADRVDASQSKTMLEMAIERTHGEMSSDMFYAMASRSTPEEMRVQRIEGAVDYSDDDDLIEPASVGDQISKEAEREACQHVTSSSWRSGVDARNAATGLGHWPDGCKVGRGHGSPYLQPIWASKMARGEKVVEARPNDGVSPKPP